ncbi:MAG: hypothetical protein CMH53_01000 [Myxococcales bacterium]|nr:hypothetical protein [Myxococcales bacterium]
MLVLKGGEVLAGDEVLATSLDSSCEGIGDVCGSDKAVCVKKHIGKTFETLKADLGNVNYPLFACETPLNEPSCVPARTLTEDIVNGSSVYAGKSDPKDIDGDGIANETDNCPKIFNPVRPMDGGKQADVDADGQGDSCDPCPVNADTTECSPVDPADLDGDGIPSVSDNCPDQNNSDQADSDGDNKGDACDACPEYANPGSAGCLATIPTLKTDSTLQEQRVALTGVVVTALEETGYFLQQAGGAVDHGGIFVYSGSSDNQPPVGTIVDITGATLTTFYGQIQIKGAVWQDTGSTEALIPRALSQAQVTALAEQDLGSSVHEGLLVIVSDVTVTDPTPSAGPGAADAKNEFVVTGSLRVDDALYKGLDYPQVIKGTVFASLTGPVSFRNDSIKLLPRDNKDVALGPPEVSTLSADKAWQRVGKSGKTLGEALQVVLTHAPAQDTVLTVSSADPLVASTAQEVIVKAGQSQATVECSGQAVGTTELTVKVKGGSKSAKATLVVLSEDATPGLASADPSPVVMPLGAAATITVNLLHPAPVGGMVLTVSSDSINLVTAPATVTATEDGLVALVPVTSGAAKGSATLTIQSGSNKLDVKIDVVDPAALSIDVGGWKIVQQNSSKTFMLPAGAKMVPGGTLVVGRNADQAKFEAFWQVQIGVNSTYIDGKNVFPSINGDETFSLKDANGAVLDGPTVKLVKGVAANYKRKLPVSSAGTVSSWSTGPVAPGGPTPGAVPAGVAGQKTPYISEFSDATGSGNYIYEFVELHLPAQ